MPTTLIRRTATIVAAAALMLSVTACGDDVPAGTIDVTALDYAYAGLPPTIKAGSTISLTNNSAMEVHEFVAIRLPDSESRSVADLVQNPDDLVAYFPAVSSVIIAAPNEDGITVEGSATLSEPGRYAIVCAIPTGADPGEYLAAAAASEGGPPDVAGGPPHFMAGMYAEVEVVE
jgi:plastocyanin